MVIKGTSCAGARRLAVHLTRTDTNERAEVRELRGAAADDLRGALLEMEAVASGARTTKPFYHASINTLAHERLTDEQRARAIDRLEAELGLTGQPRAVVVHEKEGREHCHIVWSRIDLERMAAISDSHNYRKHELVARELEREFGHERVQGAHIEREGKERPKRTPSHAEMLQAERTGLSPKEAKEQITELWRGTDSGRAFADALWNAGFVLARGDRRDFVVIDPAGGTHSLSRRVEGANAKDMRARMADIDASRLPSVAGAKEIQEARLALATARSPETQRETERDAPKVVAERDQAKADNARGTNDKGGHAGEGAAKVIGDVASGIASVFENLLGGAPEPPPPPTPHERAAADERAAEAEKEAERETRAAQANDDMNKARQAILQEYGRTPDNELDEDLEHGRQRERDRDRDRDRSR